MADIRGWSSSEVWGGDAGDSSASWIEIGRGGGTPVTERGPLELLEEDEEELEWLEDDEEELEGEVLSSCSIRVGVGVGRRCGGGGGILKILELEDMPWVLDELIEYVGPLVGEVKPVGVCPIGEPRTVGEVRPVGVRPDDAGKVFPAAEEAAAEPLGVFGNTT